MNDNKAKPHYAVEIGSTKITGVVIFLVVFVVIVLLVAIKNVIVWAAGSLLGISMPAWEAFLIILRWLAYLLAAGILALLGAGIVELAIGDRRSRNRQAEAVQASPLPRNEAIRGGAPRSGLENKLAAIVRYELEEVRQIDPVHLSDIDLARLRLELPRLFRRPEYTAEINRTVVIPIFEKYIEGCPELTTIIARYGAIRQREPFWLLRRALHILMRGKAGLAADKVWRSFDAEKLKADFAPFRDWFWAYGWPLLGMIEKLVALPAASRTEDSAFRPGRTRLMLRASGAPSRTTTSPSPSADNGSDDLSKRSPEAASRLVHEASATMRSPVPWEHPRQQLNLLEEAAREALTLDPESTDAQVLASEVDSMRTRLSAFDEWFEAQMNGDESTWSPTMNEAFAASADDMRAETVRGHAVRLFLSARPGVQHEPEARPDSSQESPATGRSEVMPEPPDACAAMERPPLILVPTLEPSASERAETLF